MKVMLQNYIRFIKPQIIEYNKKNKEKIDEKYTNDETLEDIVRKIKEMAVVGCEYRNRELHEYLIGFLAGFYNIAHKAKFKPKELTNHIDLLFWFEYQHDALQKDDEVDFEDIRYQTWDEANIRNNYEYAVLAIDNYVNLLLSKTVDYLPKLDKKEFKKLDDILDVFSSLKERLLELAKESVWFAYVFTENKQFVPFSLRYLNRFCNLGDKIEKWVEQENPLVNYINDKGFDIFGGWGNFADEVKTGNAPTKENTPVEQKHRPSKTMVEKIIRYMESLTPMYLLNDKFNMADNGHRAMFLRSIALPLYFLSSQGVEVNMVDIERYFNVVKSSLKHSRPYTLRKDRKWWFNADTVSVTTACIQLYHTDPAAHFASELMMNVYDHIFIDKTDKTKVFTKCMERLHQILARSHNSIYHSENPMKESEIANVLTVYQKNLLPYYVKFTEEQYQWIYSAAIAFVLNIRDKEVVDASYNALKTWFESRHKTEDNHQFFETNYVDNLLMSYHNKRELVERLEKEPINIVKYGNSQAYYDDIVNILKRDVDTPIKEGRGTLRKVGGDGISIVTIDTDAEDGTSKSH